VPTTRFAICRTSSLVGPHDNISGPVCHPQQPACSALRHDIEYYPTTILPHTIIHKIGHFIGLGQSDDACTVMAARGKYFLDPCPDDSAGAAFLYS
jgi:hypothetical protein